MKPIFLDYNSTTPVDPRVLDSMLPYFTEKFGNAASTTHSYGWEADEAVKAARESIAGMLKAEPSEIIFTSGSTEGVNLALKGAYQAYYGKGNHIITCTTEHKAVLDTCNFLEEAGAEVTYLGVDKLGMIDLEELEKSIRPETTIISIMAANNETGVIADMQAIGEIARKHKVIFFSDATQAIGKTQFEVGPHGPDMLCISSHKFYGPKGVGAVYVSRKNPRVNLIPLIHGGGHEKGMRSGTLNVPGIVGMGKAAEIISREAFEETGRLSVLRTLLEQELVSKCGARINGSVKNRLANTANLMFPGVKSENIIRDVFQCAVATGSACSSAEMKPSHVLKEMGLSDEESYASIRFSIGRFTSREEILRTIEYFTGVINGSK